MKVQGLVRKRKRIGVLFALMVAGAVVLAAVKAFAADENGTGETNRNAEMAGATEPNKPPMIIWHYHTIRDKPEALKLALSSGLITHVVLGGTLHRKDRDYKKQTNASEALTIVKNSGAKLIWVRVLWPLEDLFDPDYYIREIQNLRAEAREMGADLVFLDAEPSGNSPIKRYWSHRYRWNSQQRKQLKLAVNRAVKVVGKVDIMRPGGSKRRGHLAEILAELGEYRLSGVGLSTDALRRKPPYEVFPYEIFAAYLNTAREDPKAPKYTYFLVPEIFENSHLWSDKKGLFLYSKEHNALAVAKELVAYSRQLPFKTHEPGQSSNPKRQ
jgi:hypothetical protein